MAVEVQCPECGRLQPADEALTGQEVPCGNCGRKFTVVMSTERTIQPDRGLEPVGRMGLSGNRSSRPRVAPPRPLAGTLSCGSLGRGPWGSSGWPTIPNSSATWRSRSCPTPCPGMPSA